MILCRGRGFQFHATSEKSLTRSSCQEDVCHDTEDRLTPRNGWCLLVARSDVPFYERECQDWTSKKRLVALHQGADQALFEVCYHETDPPTPLHIRAIQGHVADLQVNSLFFALSRLFHCRDVPVGVTQATNTVLKSTVSWQAVEDCKQDGRLATSQHSIRSPRSTKGQTKTVLTTTRPLRPHRLSSRFNLRVDHQT